MPFECKKYHGECGARCCGIVPIPLSTWQKNQHNIQRTVKEKHKVLAGPRDGDQRKCILPITEDYLCPFLKKDLSCAIYHDRPEICRKFGDESHLMLCCPIQKSDGTPRTEEERSALENKCTDFIRNPG